MGSRVDPLGMSKQKKENQNIEGGFLSNVCFNSFLGLKRKDFIKYFFGSNAFAAIIVLALITVFLFKEGIGFFGQNHTSLTLYRKAGLEYVNIVREQVDGYTALTRYLNGIRNAIYLDYQKQGKTDDEIWEHMRSVDDFSYEFGTIGYDLQDLLSEWTETVTNLRDNYLVYLNNLEYQEQLIAEGKTGPATLASVDPVDFDAVLNPLFEEIETYKQVNEKFTSGMYDILQHIPIEADGRFNTFRKFCQDYLGTLPVTEKALEDWDKDKAVGFGESFTSFLFGKDWITNSFYQDWYGILPLLVGSLLVAIIALLIAIPLGVAAAVYVNQIASPREQQLIKPYIEFISAIPSVVIGFFGVAVWGQFVRWISQQPVLSDWISFFPISERLNAFTAGCLLALMAVPTIFTLAEDALNNVPRAYKEASFAVGANKLQTIIRIILPTSLSGIISAILLGFGRVIGETMVVLLCAGNRIAIPDFTAGLGTFFQPVHTMTGIIAQEMGEVVNGSLHYRALFVVGIFLFFISLGINFLAQKIVRRFKISVG